MGGLAFVCRIRKLLFRRSSRPVLRHSSYLPGIARTVSIAALLVIPQSQIVRRLRDIGMVVTERWSFVDGTGASCHGVYEIWASWNGNPKPLIALGAYKRSRGFCVSEADCTLSARVQNRPVSWEPE